MRVRIFVVYYGDQEHYEWADSFVGNWSEFPNWLWETHQCQLTDAEFCVMEIY